MRIPFLHPLSRLLKRGYDWMLRFADKPYAEGALFGLSFAEASFFPLPPDPLLLAMGAGQPRRALRFALVTTVASVLGALLGYAIGVFLMDSVGAWLLDLYDAERHTWGRIEAWYEENGMLALLLAAITPIPFKVFTIASGAMGFPFLPFVGASLLGRGLRFGVEGLLLARFGAPIAAWIERWFDWVALGFTVLLVGGFLAVRYLG
jgi:membrane protein YqaA with SNARE-associated domain